LAKKQPIRPIIIVKTNPREIEQGQMLGVSARLFHPRTLEPFFVSRIFMQIQARRGIEVWPLEVIRKDAAGFDIQIGTSEMKSNTDYLIRVSNNWNLSPSGSFEFSVKKKPLGISILPIVPLLVAPLLPGQQPVRFPVDDITRRDIKEFIFRTQMDMRVCPICKAYENIVFPPELWRPVIPDDTHPRCRCTYDVLFKTPEEMTASLKQIAEIAAMSEGMIEAVTAVQAVELIQVEELLNLRNEQTKRRK